MPTYTQAFEQAVIHAMSYEVGPFNPNDPETIAGLIGTPAQRKKVGYVNDPLDAGGETKYGVAKSGNPTVNIAALNWAQAKDIYFNKYWIAGGCHLLGDKLAILHFDGCVNHGIGRAGKFLQEVVGAVQDGQVGPGTAAKANALVQVQVINKLCDRREAFYRSIVANNPAQVRFLNGWLRRITEMRAFVLK